MQPLPMRVKALMLNLRIANWNRIQELLEINPEDSVKKAATLQELESCCHLLGGRWIIKSESIPATSKLIANARNALLGLFLEAEEQENVLLERCKLSQIVKLTLESEKSLFNEIATLQERKWKLKVERDEEFILAHPSILHRQSSAFQGIFKNALEFFSSGHQQKHIEMNVQPAEIENREAEKEPSKRGRKSKAK
jgi:hypothetical protein